MPEPRVSEAEIAAYERDGAVCLRGALAPAWIELLDRGVERNIARPGPWFTDFTGADGGARCIKDDFCWTWIPEYEDFARRSPCAALVGELMRAREVCFIEDQYFQKAAGAATPTPWHQDQSYYEVAGDWCVAWVPLNPVAAEDSLRFVAGSHRGPLYLPQDFTGGGGGPHITPPGPAPPPPPAAAGEPGRWPILAWAMQPGDLLVFHPRTLHANAGNRAPHRSRRLSLRWVAESARYVRKPLPWATFRPDHGLVDGQRILGELFPLVWTRAAGLLAAG